MIMTKSLDDVAYGVIRSGVDFTNRRIYWGSIGAIESVDGFEWGTVEYMVRALHQMYAAGSGPIELHMSSPGGDVYPMLKLIDEIAVSPCQIRFIGSGLIASAATWVMAVCDYRSIHKNTVVMIHNGSEAVVGTHTDNQIAVTHYKTLQEKLDKIFAENSKMSADFYSELCQRDVYLTPEEVLAIGLVDEIIQPVNRTSFQAERVTKANQGDDISKIQKLGKDLYSRVGLRKPSKIEISIKEER